MTQVSLKEKSPECANMMAFPKKNPEWNLNTRIPQYSIYD